MDNPYLSQELRNTQYKSHELTQACIYKGLLYKGDRENVRHDQFFREMARRYNEEVLRETFRYALDKTEERKPAYKFGYFKKVFESELPRFARELPMIKKEREEVERLQQEIVKQEEVQVVVDEMQECKEFAKKLPDENGFHAFMNNLGGNKEPLLTEDEEMTINLILTDKLDIEQCKSFMTKMRSQGWGDYGEK